MQQRYKRAQGPYCPYPRPQDYPARGYRFAVLLLALLTSSAIAQPPGWLTRSYDNARSGWNPHETVLTQAAVIQRGLVRQTTIPVHGDARGMEAQPLILPAVKITGQPCEDPDGGSINCPPTTHDLIVLPSMADVVRGVDAETGAGLWQVTLGVPVQGSRAIDFHTINDKWGCLASGVIDPDTRRWYGVCWVSPDGSGSPKTARHMIFGLNLADGSEAFAPVTVAGKSGANDYNAAMRKARSSAVLIRQGVTKTMIECTGTVMETGAGSNGFCFAFDLGTNRITAMLAMTAGQGAGIWMAGQGLVAGPDNSLYAITGNGSFDGVSQFGESFVKLAYTPPHTSWSTGVPAKTTPASLKVVDHWTPWTDLQRSGQAQTMAGKMAGVSLASESAKPVGAGMSIPLANARVEGDMNAQNQAVARVYPAMATGAWSDEDWGSAGPACLFAIGVCVASGKDGIGYPVRTASLGHTQPADLLDPKANCAKLASYPVWLTMSPGAVDPCPTDATTLNFLPWGATAHLHMTPVQLYDPLLKSWVLFVWGENAQLHKWAIDATGKLRYIAQSHEYASADVRGTPPGGMPGGFCAGSSNGADPNSMLLVCSIPYGDANARVTNGRLLVYDPVHLDTDGSLKVLWDSQRWGIPYLFNKFMPPVIWNGRVYLPNYGGGVDVYALTPATGGQP